MRDIFQNGLKRPSNARPLAHRTRCWAALVDALDALRTMGKEAMADTCGDSGTPARRMKVLGIEASCDETALIGPRRRGDPPDSSQAINIRSTCPRLRASSRS